MSKDFVVRLSLVVVQVALPFLRFREDSAKVVDNVSRRVQLFAVLGSVSCGTQPSSLSRRCSSRVSQLASQSYLPAASFDWLTTFKVVATLPNCQSRSVAFKLTSLSSTKNNRNLDPLQSDISSILRNKGQLTERFDKRTQNPWENEPKEIRANRIIFVRIVKLDKVSLKNRVTGGASKTTTPSNSQLDANERKRATKRGRQFNVSQQ